MKLANLYSFYILEVIMMGICITGRMIIPFLIDSTLFVAALVLAVTKIINKLQAISN